MGNIRFNANFVIPLLVADICRALGGLIQAFSLFQNFQFSHELSYVGDMIQEDAAAILALGQRIKALDADIARLSESSAMARRLISSRATLAEGGRLASQVQWPFR